MKGMIWLLLAASLGAQAHVHPYLAARMSIASADEQLPVYFVMEDRLRASHWFPRVDRMPIDARRALVVQELRQHTERTQGPLLRLLDGRGDRIHSNWLGNFVQVRATVDVIEEASALPGVGEVWFDHAPPASEVQDIVPGESRCQPPAVFNPTAGNGPLNTRADLCWCIGVDGSGVVIMNADSGINLNHNDLVNRVWNNPGEVINGIDDDGNGYIDDVYGWSFANNGWNVDDGGGHGTRTAGALVADGSCNGTVYGQAPGAQVMTGQINGEADQWNAVQYALTMGAAIQTSSHSYKNNQTPVPNYKMHRDVADNSLAAGLIRTNSSSNNGGACNASASSIRRPFNVSVPANVPAPYIAANQHFFLVGGRSGVLGIGAHDLSNGLALFSPCGPSAWNLPELLALVPTYNTANWDPINHNDYPWNAGLTAGLLKPDLTGPTGTTVPDGPGACGTTTFSGTSNSTPNVAGVFALWKSANPSLKPEDVAMIAHQTAVPTGAQPGKEDGWGAGRIDARSGLDLALCVHRVNGLPSWTIDVTASTTGTLELDAVPGSAAVIAVGGTRTASTTHGGVVGIGGGAWILWQSTVPASGDVSLSVQVPAALVGTTFYTQAFIDDQTITNGLLSSNVVEIRIVP